jgi:hypothetical protein
MSKLLVLYVFHIYNNRVEHFINNGIFYDENIDFIIISNNKNNNFEVPHFVKKMFRDNVGYDNGGWSEALLTNNLYQNYDNFIFLNSSVMGPYVASYFTGKWTDIYLNGLKNNVKLFGSTINLNNCRTSAHVQSYIFAMDKITLQYLINCEIFSITNYAKNFDEAICNKEVLMSSKIIQNGWNIGSLLECFKDVDFTFTQKSFADYNLKVLDDPMGSYYRGAVWNETQLVFIKGNRVQIRYL